MRRIIHCAAITTLIFAPCMARAAIIINEFHYDDGGGDDREFIELYNNGLAAVDVSGWVVRNSDTVAPPADNNSDYTIGPATSIAAGGYFVLGNPGVLNVNQTYPTTTALENDNEAMQLLDSTGAVVDTVSYETNKGPVAVAMEGPGIWSNTNSPDVAGSPLNVTISQGRFVDGEDTNNNGRDFGMRPSTPGTSNNTGTMMHYLPPDPTGSTVGTDVAGLKGTFVNARYIDPTVADANNPNAIPASQYTGNRAIVAWDPAGGGNAVTSQLVYDTTKMGYRVWAYLDTSDQPQNSNAAGTLFTGSEVSIYGVGGGDPLNNLTDLGGNVGLGAVALPAAESANGTTGIAWVYERTAISGMTPATQTLYLVDANDGGDSDVGGNTPLDWTILQAIDISGMASNWYDLSIKVDAAGIGVATFNGVPYPFTTSAGLHSGAFNVTYRENLQIGADGTPDAIMRPPTFTLCPEPTSLALFALGLAAMAARRRR